MSSPSLLYLPPYSGKYLNVIIETPIGSRIKYAYDARTGLYKVSHILPVGSVFPYNFGFIPSTKAEDGDPIDVLLIMDAPAYPGCLFPSTLLGVIEAEQTELDGRKVRNDRLIAVSIQCPVYREVQALHELSPQLLSQIELFFVSYNNFRGKKFQPLGRQGPKRAEELLQLSMQRFEQQRPPAVI
jgi:inorganic pyrophosphatase